MAGSTWPSSVAGARAKASEIEAKFDWLEQHIVPMSAGTKTDNTYDAGETNYRWRRGYFGPGAVGNPALTVRSSDMGIYSASVSTLNMGVSGTSVAEFNNKGYVTLPLQPGFMALNTNNITISALDVFQFNSKILDRGNVYTTTTHAFIVPTTGIYVMGFSLGLWSPTTTGLLSVDLRVAANVYRETQNFTIPTAGATSTSRISMSKAGLFTLGGGETCTVGNASSSIPWIQSGGSNECMFYAFKIA